MLKPSIPPIMTWILRFPYLFTDPQIQSRAKKQSPYARLLAARDAALAMTAVSSQIPDHQKSDLDAQDSLSIVCDCIIPRIQKMLASIERGRHLGPRWCSSSTSSGSEGKYESTMAHIELMIYLIRNRDSFGPKFWSSIARWQIETYRTFCEKLLREYREATYDIKDDRAGVEAFIGALESAVKRAQALPDPDPEKARASDVFSIRSPYDDPDVKALIDSDRFTPGKRLELQNAVEELLLQQPMFPPECYALQELR